jgi:hypothetical protein
MRLLHTGYFLNPDIFIIKDSLTMNEFQNDNNLYNIYRGSNASKKSRKDDSKGIIITYLENEARSSYLKNFHHKNRSEREQIQLIFNETDNSMEKILNSSMSQLEKVIQGLEEPDKKATNIQDLIKQNTLLKANLAKMKKILYKSAYLENKNCRLD